MKFTAAEENVIVPMREVASGMRANLHADSIGNVVRYSKQWGDEWMICFMDGTRITGDPDTMLRMVRPIN